MDGQFGLTIQRGMPSFDLKEAIFKVGHYLWTFGDFLLR